MPNIGPWMRCRWCDHTGVAILKRRSPTHLGAFCESCHRFMRWIKRNEANLAALKIQERKRLEKGRRRT